MREAPHMAKYIITRREALGLTTLTLAAAYVPRAFGRPDRPVVFLSDGQHVTANGDVEARAAPQHADGIEQASKANSLSDDEIRTHLGTLLAWSGAAPFYSYFHRIPRRFALKLAVASDYADARKGDTLYVDPYGVGKEKVRGIKVVLPVALKDRATTDGLSVIPSGFTNPLPILAEDLLVANFLSGLLTRLMVGRYFRAWNMKDVSKVLNFVPSSPPELPIDFSTAANYPDVEGGVAKGLEELLKRFSLQAMGIAYGWSCAQQLEGSESTDPAYLAAMWKLLRNRFSPELCGRTVGYTLNFLQAYVKAAAIRSGGEPITDPALLLDQVKLDEGVRSAKKMLVQFQAGLFTEGYYLQQNSTASASVRSAQFYFTRGFSEGVIAASDDFFDLAFGLGFELGYQTGFRDGYSHGYTVGFQDGYQKGWAAAWREANVTIANLQARIKDLEDDGWGPLKALKTVADVTSAVATVIMIL